MAFLFEKTPILNQQIPKIKTKIDDKMQEIYNNIKDKSKASYLDSISKHVTKESDFKVYADMYTKIVKKVKDVYAFGCMNKLSSDTNTILFYELCKLIQSSLNLFCEEDADNIKSRLLKMKCDPTHRQFTDKEHKQIIEDKKQLTKHHLSFITKKDIFIAILLHYCECHQTEMSETIQYMLTDIFPKIQNMSTFLHFMISNSNTVCQRGGKVTHKKRRFKKQNLKKKKTMKHR